MSYSEEDDFREKDNIVAAIRHWMDHASIDPQHVRALEIGGSGGLLAGLLAQEVDHVTCTDVVNWNSLYDGCFPKLLKDKFERNGRAFEYSNIEFLFGDAQNLVYRDNLFDLVFSLNAFEHIPSPIVALREIMRVTRPSGLIYLTFDPVWTADSGSHFLHYIQEPWGHLIHDDAQIASIMTRNGASANEVESYLNDMNRLPVSYYRDNFLNVISENGGSILYSNSWSGTTDPSYADHPNLVRASEKMEMVTEDLLVRGFCFVIKKGYL